jgi:hypothetical protein
MKAYEIHTFKDGVWKIDSVFDDRELALHEANKIDEGSRYAAVRVIEENYDETSDLTTTRTIFRGNRSARKKAEAAASAAPKKRPTSHGPRNGNGQIRKRRPPPPEKKQSNVLVPVLILLIILFAGLAGMLLLRQAA